MNKTDKLVADYIKKKGAVQWREVQAFMAGVDESKPAPQPAEVAACLGRLLSTGELSTPWTSRQVPYVWWRHKDTKWNRSAGHMRQLSRKRYPKLWPVSARVEQTRAKREANRVKEVELMDHLYEAIQRRGPISMGDLCEAVEMSSPAVRRRLHIMEDERIIVRGEHQTGQRGRPYFVWSVAPNVDEGPLIHDEGEDEGSERSAVIDEEDPDVEDLDF